MPDVTEAAADPCRQTWYLRQVDLFDAFSEDDFRDLTSLVETRYFRAGELIIGPETSTNSVYIVLDGTVRLLHRGPRGREITVDHLGRGRIFGIATMFPGRSPDRPGAHLLAQALTDVVVCAAQSPRFLQFISQRPEAMLNLAMLLARRLVEVEEHLARLASADASTRLALELCRLANEAATDAPGGGRRLTAMLTQAALAQGIGCSRETITRLLAIFEDAGYIRREGRQIVVINPAHLAEQFS